MILRLTISEPLEAFFNRVVLTQTLTVVVIG